ncbi:MAG: type II toxin-antitoxin system VapC family toxin [Deltaproteobacteria bacterium]|nr:type II toxin-antitoxin system VapC family toxin [Deltaproteobacteria bacterium]
MIFIDSNIPMYLIGADHPHKREAIALLEHVVTDRRRLVTNTEVFQEILHRYTAIQRKEAIQPAFDALRDLVDDVFPIHDRDIQEAKDLILAYETLTARDALHVAHMRLRHITTLVSFDRGFDAFPDLTRLPSAEK